MNCFEGIEGDVDIGMFPGPYAAFLQHAPKCTPRLGHTPKIYIGKAIFIENYHFVESDSKQFLCTKQLTTLHIQIRRGLILHFFNTFSRKVSTSSSSALSMGSLISSIVGNEGPFWLIRISAEI